ncbi:hypothetical protein OSTOST_10712 [Ostertagia ostertagi]
MKALAGTQIVLVYYGGGLSTELVLSTTDSQLLKIFLEQQPFEYVDPNAPPESPNDALLLGLKSQLTARGLVALVSRGGDFPIDEAIAKQLSSQEPNFGSSLNKMHPISQLWPC